MQANKKRIFFFSSVGFVIGLVTAVISFGLLFGLGGLAVTFGSMSAMFELESRLLADLATLLLSCPPSLIFAALLARIIWQSGKTRQLFSVPVLVGAVLGCAFLFSGANLFLGRLVANGTGEMSYFFVFGYSSIFFPSLLASGAIGWAIAKFVATLAIDEHATHNL